MKQEKKAKKLASVAAKLAAGINIENVPDPARLSGADRADQCCCARGGADRQPGADACHCKPTPTGASDAEGRWLLSCACLA